MRIITFNPNASRREPTRRLRQAARGAQLRIVERIGPANDASTGRLIQFHTHGGPRPAA
jgi:hypothetical protein